MSALNTQKPGAVALESLTRTLAERLNMGDGSGLAEVLKRTAFRTKQNVIVSDEQLCALLVVANQYGLNPWTREIYAFPDKSGGIVPVVGVDGWSRILNGNPAFDGINFAQDADSCSCTIYRKDRTYPTTVTEWMVECNRGTDPWINYPYRMLRHKATIQCARLAFGFVGIYETDEAERIIEMEHGDSGIGDIATAPMPRRASASSTSEVQALPLPTDPVVLPVVMPKAAQAPVAMPDPAPAPAPQQMQVEGVDLMAMAEDTSDPASRGERTNIIVKVRAKKQDMNELLGLFGLSRLDPKTLDGLTKNQFKAMNEALR